MSRKDIIKAMKRYPSNIYTYTFIGEELSIFYRKGDEKTLKTLQRDLAKWHYHVVEVERDNKDLDVATFLPMYIN